MQSSHDAQYGRLDIMKRVRVYINVFRRSHIWVLPILLVLPYTLPLLGIIYYHIIPIQLITFTF